MERKLRVIIVTYHWPPQNTIATHRPYSWARHWSRKGVDVVVLTSRKKEFDSPLDLDVATLDSVSVYEVDYSSPVGGVRSYISNRSILAVARKIRNFLKRFGLGGLDSRSNWYKAALPVALDLAKSADVVVSTYSPDSTHFLAERMKACNPDIYWVADYRDLWSKNHIAVLSRLEESLLEKLERRVVGENADLVCTVSKDLQGRLYQFLKKDTLLIYNGFDIDEKLLRERLSRRVGARQGRLRLVYTGRLYEGYRDPSPLLNCLVNIKKRGVISDGAVKVIFFGPESDFLTRLAAKHEYKEFIEIAGNVPHDTATKAQREADVLLLLENSAPEARGVLTGKLFEYIASGRPILCIGSRPEYEIGEVLKRSRTGLVFQNNDDGRLEMLVEDTLLGRGMYSQYAPDVDWVLGFSRERIANQFLKEIIERRKGGRVHCSRS